MINLKYILKLILFTLTPILTFSQSDSAVVHREFSKLFIEVDKGNYDYLFDMMYPKFYEIIPRDVIQTAMEQALNSDEMELKLYDSHIEEVKFMQELNGVKYFRIKYSTKMSMKMLDTTNRNEDDFDRNAFILIALNKEFGEENVSYLEDLDKFEVKTSKNSLAILDPLYTGWKIINVEKAYQPVLVKILPQEILDQF